MRARESDIEKKTIEKEGKTEMRVEAGWGLGQFIL